MHEEFSCHVINDNQHHVTKYFGKGLEGWNLDLGWASGPESLNFNNLSYSYAKEVVFSCYYIWTFEKSMFYVHTSFPVFPSFPLPPVSPVSPYEKSGIMLIKEKIKLQMRQPKIKWRISSVKDCAAFCYCAYALRILGLPTTAKVLCGGNDYVGKTNLSKVYWNEKRNEQINYIFLAVVGYVNSLSVPDMGHFPAGGQREEWALLENDWCVTVHMWHNPSTI